MPDSSSPAAASKPTKRRSPRWHKYVLWSLATVIALVLGFWLIAPTVLRSRLQSEARDRAGLNLEIDSLLVLRNPAVPLEMRGLHVATNDAPTSGLLNVDNIALRWAGPQTPPAAEPSRRPPRLVIEGLSADLLRDRTGAVNFRPGRPVVQFSEPAKSASKDDAAASTAPADATRATNEPKADKPAKRRARKESWLTDVALRDGALRMAHDSNDSKTRGEFNLRWDEIHVLRQPPAAPAEDPRIERLDVTVKGLALDGPQGWGENLAMLRLPNVKAAVVVPADRDEKIRVTTLDIDGGAVRRARDHKSRWQETHVKRLVSSILDKNPPKLDEDDEDETVVFPLAATPTDTTPTASAVPPAPTPTPTPEERATAAREEAKSDRSDWPIVERASLKNIDWIVEAQTPVGFESVTYHIDTAEWLGADAAGDELLPRSFHVAGTVGDHGQFRLAWNREADPATAKATKVSLVLHTRDFPFHPLVWGAWKHDRPEFGEVRRAILDGDVEVTWTAERANLSAKGSFRFRDVEALPDTRSTWQRLAESAPSAWPSILTDIKRPDRTDAEDIVFVDNREMKEFDAFVAWQMVQDAFIAARLRTAERMREDFRAARERKAAEERALEEAKAAMTATPTDGDTTPVAPESTPATGS